MKTGSRQHCEYLREEARNNFDKVRATWCDLLRWALPHRSTWILSQTPGQRKNQHIVDPTHILALRSFVAGFLEGNTSASRPWFRITTKDGQLDENEEVKGWLQHFTERTLINLGSSNFYHAAGKFYYDYGVVNTGALYFEERNTDFFVHSLMPGAYFVINDSYGNASILIREFSLNVKSLVDAYKVGDDWSNISNSVKKMYKEGIYTEKVDIAHCTMENPDFDPENPDVPDNRQWLELTYELGGDKTKGYTDNLGSMTNNVFLKRYTGRRKPFVIGKSSDDFEYGEKGPTQDSLGLIKSLNKKAIGKDQALEQILKPALQGPASLRKSYVSHAPNSFVPIDARSAAGGQKLESIFSINPAIGSVIQDVGDLRSQVDKLYFADFLLYLSKNPKTRTATETAAILEEQQRIIGPNLQGLNFSFNGPVLDWAMDYTLYEDPFLRPIPEALRGQELKPDYVSVFAQAQKAADLPAINQYIQMMQNVAQLDPKVLNKFNTDKLADLYEDRLYLPSGLNKPQSEVDKERQAAQQQAARQQDIEQTQPAMAKTAKDQASAQQMRQQ